MDNVIAQQARQHERVSRSLVDSRRFAAADLGCALIAGTLWYLSDGRLGPWPLLIASIPWFVRAARGRFPVKPTRFDMPLAGFLISAGFAASIAYNPTIAWNKFWLIIGATVLFYAFAGQRSANLWPIVTGLASFGGAISLYFLLTHDWSIFPAKIRLINALAEVWMTIRPGLLSNFHQLHFNVAGGMMAMLFPFSVAAAIRGVQKRRYLMLIIGITMGFMMSIGILFTTSRGAWLALAGAMLAWMLWSFAGSIYRRLFLSRRQTLGLLFAVLLGFGLTLIIVSPGG
jgi:hypothetical protein